MWGKDFVLEQNFRTTHAMLVIYMWLCLVRLRAETKEGGTFGQSLYENFNHDLELRITKAGVTAHYLCLTLLKYRHLCYLRLLLLEGVTFKVWGPFMVTFKNWTAMLEWHVVRCGYKIRHQQDMFPKEIGLHAQNLLYILTSIVNIISGTCITI